MAGERKYSDTEMREILERALGKQAPGSKDEREPDPSGLTHAELLAIGEEVGVPPEAMARAAVEVTRAKLDAEAVKSIKSRHRKWLMAHAAVFALVNGLLFTVNYLTTPGEWWVLFSVFFWGLALAAQAGVTAALGKSPSPRALERERRKLEAGRPRLRIDAPADGEQVSDTAPNEESGATPSRVSSRS